MALIPLEKYLKNASSNALVEAVKVFLRSDFLRAWSSSSILRGIMEAIQVVPKSAFAMHSGADPSYSMLPSKSWKSSLELW